MKVLSYLLLSVLPAATTESVILTKLDCWDEIRWMVWGKKIDKINVLCVAVWINISMYLLYMYETFTEPTRINLPPEQTPTKPQVSLGLLLENLPQPRVNFGSTRGFTMGLLLGSTLCTQVWSRPFMYLTVGNSGPWYILTTINQL